MVEKTNKENDRTELTPKASQMLNASTSSANLKQPGAFFGLIDYLKNNKSKIGTTLGDIGNAMMLKSGQSSGEMVDGHFVPNTSLGLENLPGVMQQRASNELTKEQLEQQRQDRLADIAYKNQLLNIRIAQAMQNQQDKNNKTLQEAESTNKDKDVLRQQLKDVQDDVGSGIWKRIKRATARYNPFTTADQDVANIQATVKNIMGRKIRELPAYKNGVLTDADFKNATESAFDVNADLPTNINNINAILSSLGVKDNQLINLNDILSDEYEMEQ